MKSKKLKLAIVDDEPYALRTLEDYLKHYFKISFEVVIKTTSGSELMDQVNAGNVPDVIFLDIEMPGINGIDVINWLDKNHPQIKVVVVSAYDELGISIPPGEVEIIDWLLKPILKQDFDRVNGILKKYKQIGLDQKFRRNLPLRIGVFGTVSKDVEEFKNEIELYWHRMFDVVFTTCAQEHLSNNMEQGPIDALVLLSEPLGKEIIDIIKAVNQDQNSFYTVLFSRIHKEDFYELFEQTFHKGMIGLINSGSYYSALPALFRNVAYDIKIEGSVNFLVN